MSCSQVSYKSKHTCAGGAAGGRLGLYTDARSGLSWVLSLPLTFFRTQMFSQSTKSPGAPRAHPVLRGLLAGGWSPAIPSGLHHQCHRLAPQGRWGRCSSPQPWTDPKSHLSQGKSVTSLLRRKVQNGRPVVPLSGWGFGLHVRLPTALVTSHLASSRPWREARCCQVAEPSALRPPLCGKRGRAVGERCCPKGTGFSSGTSPPAPLGTTSGS